MKIIGITGKLTSGKTTFAKFLWDRFLEKGNKSVHILSFAQLLKEMIFNAGLCSREELWEKKTDFSRLMMQKIGTEIIRNQVDPDFWVNKMKERIKEIGKNNWDCIIIIDDVRYINEAEFIKAFRHAAPLLLRIERPSIKSTSNHKSETEQDEIKVDYSVMNDGTLDDLKKMSHTPFMRVD
jgi:adenylate kinase family enzyme